MMGGSVELLVASGFAGSLARIPASILLCLRPLPLFPESALKNCGDCPTARGVLTSLPADDEHAMHTAIVSAANLARFTILRGEGPPTLPRFDPIQSWRDGFPVTATQDARGQKGSLPRFEFQANGRFRGEQASLSASATCWRFAADGAAHSRQ